MNLLIWKWAEAYDSPAKRKRLKLKFADVTRGFTENSFHPAFGVSDFSYFLEKVFEKFGRESPELPFIVERYEMCLSFSYMASVRFEVVPVIGRLAMSMGLNAAEF